jgi:regulator of protease activity HflC (stomatin/prohibitin superfamily)
MDAIFLLLIVFLLAIFVAILMVSIAIRIVPEYVRGVVFRQGRFVGIYGPGIFITLPFIDRAVMVDLRQQTRSLAALAAITADHVRLVVDLSWQYRITDPAKSVLNVANIAESLQKTARQAWLDAVERQPYHAIVQDRSPLREEILQQLQITSANWGVEITAVQLGEIKRG